MRTEEGADPSGAWTAVVGVIGAVIIFAIIVGLQAFFNRAHEDELARKVYSAVYDDLVRMQATQEENLNSYRWLDRDAGTVAVPIDRAKELIIQEARERSQSGAASSMETEG